MHIVKSVGVLSLAKILGLLQACMGLLLAPVFLLIGLLGSMAGQQKTPFAGMFGVFLALFMPVLYGIFGFLSGAIFGLLYNLFAKVVGGLELELDLRPQTLTAPYPIVPPGSVGTNA